MLKVRTLLHFLQVRSITSSWIKKKLPTSQNMDRNEAYFLYKVGDPSFYLTLKFSLGGGKERQLNFNRKPSETVGELLHRIQSKVEGLVEKKKKKKKNPEEDIPQTEGPVHEVKLIIKEEPVSEDLECAKTLIDNSNETLQLKIGCSLYRIVINSPWINNLNLPLTILAGFPIRPSKIDGMFFEKANSIFKWFSESKPNVWDEVGCSYTYFPSNKEIGKRLKLICTPSNGKSNGPDFETLAKNPVEAGPGPCPFEKRHAFTKERASGKNFRITSYNILADIYCDSDYTRSTLFPYCPPYAMKIDYRQLLLFKELLGYNSDIICLQEVDSKVYTHNLTPELEDNGYRGIFTKKDGQVSEGLAIFFNAARFKLVEHYESVFCKELNSSPVFKEIWEKVSYNEAYVKRITDRSNVVQAILLESIDNGEYLLIGNTHLYFHPDADHVRLVQGALIITWMNHILKTTREKYPGKQVSLIQCGDFNTTPECGIYQLYTTGLVPDHIVDWKSNAEEALSNVSISQPTLLSSACGTPQFTNFTEGFAECIDYIFYEKDSLSVSQVIPFPSEDELREHIALPSICFPSDHIALIADLSFIR